MELTEIKCPCCEGTVQIKINQKEAKCNYCDTVILIVLSNIILLLFLLLIKIKKKYLKQNQMKKKHN